MAGSVRRPDESSSRSDSEKALRDHIIKLLASNSAHVDSRSVLESIPFETAGRKPAGAPHTPWQLLEHLRIAQWDILEFSRNPRHVSPKFPHGYWPETEAPPDESAWRKSISQFTADLESMQKLVASPSTDLFAAIPHGNGQTVLREALLVADHNAYHLGQLVLLSRLAGTWREGAYEVLV